MTAEEELLIETLQKEKATLAFQNKALEASTLELKTYVQNLSNKVDDLTKDNRDLAKEKESLDDQITDLENDLEEAQDNECHHDEDLLRRKTDGFDDHLESLVGNLKFLKRKLVYPREDFVIREAFDSIFRDAEFLDHYNEDVSYRARY